MVLEKVLVLEIDLPAKYNIVVKTDRNRVLLINTIKREGVLKNLLKTSHSWTISFN